MCPKLSALGEKIAWITSPEITPYRKGHSSLFEECPVYSESKVKSQLHLLRQDLFVLALCQRKLGRLL